MQNSLSVKPLSSRLISLSYHWIIICHHKTELWCRWIRRRWFLNIVKNYKFIANYSSKFYIAKFIQLLLHGAWFDDVSRTTYLFCPAQKLFGFGAVVVLVVVVVVVAWEVDWVIVWAVVVCADVDVVARLKIGTTSKITRNNQNGRFPFNYLYFVFLCMQNIFWILSPHSSQRNLENWPWHLNMAEDPNGLSVVQINDFKLKLHR